MGFIDDKNVCDRHGYLVGPHAARPQRLDGGDLHRVFQIDVQSGLNQAVINRQLERGLLQDLAAMGQDQHPLPLGDCAFNNVAGDDGLTAASGRIGLLSYSILPVF
jgi:hypothetical protein